MITLPENYTFAEYDYWDLRKQALLKLSLSTYEEVIRFGQKYGFEKAKFDLALDEMLSVIYWWQNDKNRFLFCREEGGNRIANDEVYPFLDALFQRDDFLPFRYLFTGKSYGEYKDRPQLLDSPLYHVAMQGDGRMMKFLLNHVDRYAEYHQGLYDAVLKHYLYMKLPHWGELANVTGSQEDLLCAVEKQAEKLNVAQSPVLRCLLQAGFPSAYTRLPLEYSDVRIDFEKEKNIYHFTVDYTDISTSPRGNGSSGYAHNDDDMVRALSESGEFFPFTCECGEEGDAGLWEPIQCLKTSKDVRWYKPYPLPMTCFAFRPIPVLRELELTLRQIKECLKPEWEKREKREGDEFSFPYGPFGASYATLCRDLSFCRRRLIKMKNEENRSAT